MSTCCNCAGTPPPTSVGSCCYLNGEDIECTDVLLDDPTIRMTGPECHILPQGEFHLGVECHQFSCVTTTTTAAPAAYCFEQVSTDLEYCFRQNSTIKTVSVETSSEGWTRKGQVIKGEINTRDEDDDPPPPTDPWTGGEVEEEIRIPPKRCYDFPETSEENKYIAKCDWWYDDWIYRKQERNATSDHGYNYYESGQQLKRFLGVDLIECEWDEAISNWEAPGHCLCSAPVDRNGVDIGPKGDKVAAFIRFLSEPAGEISYLPNLLTVTGRVVNESTLSVAGRVRYSTELKQFSENVSLFSYYTLERQPLHLETTASNIAYDTVEEFLLYGSHMSFVTHPPWDQEGEFYVQTSCTPR